VDQVTNFYASRHSMSSPDPGARDRIEKSLEIIRSLRPRTLLDVGCGDGSTALRIERELGGNVFGVDISEASVHSAIAKGIPAKTCQVGVQSLPYTDGSIDLVYMAEVIEHLYDPDRALRDIARVLVDGGHLVLSTPNIACLLNRILLPLGLQPFFTEVSTRTIVGRRFAALGEGSASVGHLRIGSLPALRELLEMNGFTTVRAVGATFLKTEALRRIESVTCRRPSLASILVLHARKRI